MSVPYTQAGFAICPRCLRSRLGYSYRPCDYSDKLKHEKLMVAQHRKRVCDLPICKSQVVEFRDTWKPNDLENQPHILEEYIFEASRIVCMTAKYQ